MTGFIEIWPQIRDLLLYAAFFFVIAILGYAAMMLTLSRRAPRRDAAGAPSAGVASEGVASEGAASEGAASEGAASTNEPFVVFVLPCLNEARVIGASLDRLLSFDREQQLILVVDDGSDDNTAAIVAGYKHPQVRLLRRFLPNARKGKGEALNAAYQYLVSSDALAGKDPRDVILVVLDADGRLETNALAEVLPMFADPQIGGVQIGVRINNRHVNKLARMQDLEFVTFTDVFQRGRRHLGSVCLGGNGQFMRVAALMTLGDRPWTTSLTEDLDLGVRLIVAGWRNDYCPTTAVHQQGVTEFRRLVRQRTRWFHGHLQSWALLSDVVRNVRGRARRDLFYHLTAPALLLTASLLTIAFLTGIVAVVREGLGGDAFHGWWLLSAYVLALAPATAFSQVYYEREKHEGMTRLGAFRTAHLYVLYGFMWYLAGWGAIGRIIRDRVEWAKTDRHVETDETTLPAIKGAVAADDSWAGASQTPLSAEPAQTARFAEGEALPSGAAQPAARGSARRLTRFARRAHPTAVDPAPHR